MRKYSSQRKRTNISHNLATLTNDVLNELHSSLNLLNSIRVDHHGPRSMSDEVSIGLKHVEFLKADEVELLKIFVGLDTKLGSGPGTTNLCGLIPGEKLLKATRRLGSMEDTATGCRSSNTELRSVANRIGDSSEHCVPREITKFTKTTTCR